MINKKGQVGTTLILIVVALLIGGTIVYTTMETEEFNKEDVTIYFCNDNQQIVYNENLIVSWKSGENETDSKTGGFEESLRTYNTYPECINPEWLQWKSNPNRFKTEPIYQIDMTCLTKKCNSIVSLNQLNGTITEIWRKGDIW